MRVFYLLFLFVLLTACSSDKAEETAKPVRGLKTVLIAETEKTTLRRYPSVLQPADISVLSFELGGKLGEINLSVGQRVEVGDIIAELDSKALELQLENAKAAVDQARVTAKNAKDNANRLAALAQKGSVATIRTLPTCTLSNKITAKLVKVPSFSGATLGSET